MNEIPEAILAEPILCERIAKVRRWFPEIEDLPPFREAYADTPSGLVSSAAFWAQAFCNVSEQARQAGNIGQAEDLMGRANACAELAGMHITSKMVYEYTVNEIEAL